MSKEIIDSAIRTEWKRKWQTTPHYKHTKHFFSGSNKNVAKKIINLSRSHLTRLIAIITGFNCLSYIQFNAPQIPSAGFVVKIMKPYGTCNRMSQAKDIQRGHIPRLNKVTGLLER